AEALDVDHVVRPEPLAPGGKAAGDLRPHALAAVELDPVPLAVVETDRLDALVAAQRKAEADGRILPAREQHQRSSLRLHAHPLTGDPGQIRLSTYTPSASATLPLRGPGTFGGPPHHDRHCNHYRPGNPGQPRQPDRRGRRGARRRPSRPRGRSLWRLDRR